MPGRDPSARRGARDTAGRSPPSHARPARTNGPILPRRQLFTHLDGADASGLRISGPPRSGKSTLVRSWLAARRCMCVRYPMTDEDGDVARLFHGIAEAARAAVHGRPPPLPAFGPEHLAHLEGFATRFFAALAGALPRGAALVLDGCPDLSAAPLARYRGLSKNRSSCAPVPTR